eukprot:6369748-Karenia_brevis.AAC.1
MAVQNNNWQNVENVFRVTQLTVKRAVESRYLYGPLISSPQRIAKTFSMDKMSEMCYQPLEHGWKNPDGSD